MTTRRQILSLLGTLPLSALSLTSPRGVVGHGDRPPFMPQDIPGLRPSGEELDEALEMLAPYGASYRGGLSNHGPMTAEALMSLGRQDAVVPWVERYRSRLEARPAPNAKIEEAQWQAALGDRARTRDWEDFFSRQLAESPWKAVLGRWVPRLAPGIAAAGLHGVIRVGHAVCALKARECALRLDELARALGYWAAEYMALPGQAKNPGTLAPSIALGQVELLPRDQRSGGGLITSEMRALLSFEPFADVIDLVDPTAGQPDFLADLLGTFAGLYVNTKSGSFVFLHAITGAASIVELLPFVEPAQRSGVLAYTWQVTAGIFARYGQPSLVPEVHAKDQGASPKRLTQLAVESGDEHTIKLAAACIREQLRNPDPRIMAAAASRIL